MPIPSAPSSASQPLPDPHPAPIDSWGFAHNQISSIPNIINHFTSWSQFSTLMLMLLPFGRLCTQMNDLYKYLGCFIITSCDIIFGVLHAEQRRISAEGLAAPDTRRIESWNSKHTLTNPPISRHWWLNIYIEECVCMYVCTVFAQCHLRIPYLPSWIKRIP